MQDISNYSVALCMYNGEKYIQDQLNSILNQTIPPSEIIICDDGSTDKGINIARKLLEGSKVKYKIITNAVNIGVANNFLKAIKQCSYEYIFTADQDDLWREDKASIALKAFEANPSVLLFFSNGDLVDAENHYLGRTIWDSIGISKDFLIGCKWFDYMLPKHIVTGATLAIKKELVNDIDSIPEGFLHDDWLAWKAAILGAIYASPERLIRYRQHVSNVVGMKTNYLTEKMRHWLGYLGNMQKVREKRVERFTTLGEGFNDILSYEQKRKFDSCLQFWNEASLLNSMSKLKAVRWIIKNQRKGNYNLYYNGSKGVIRDIIEILFKVN